MTDELKACPFCGGEAEVVHSAANNVLVIPSGCSVYCKDLNCSAEGPWDLGESGAIECWNTRPIEDAQAAEIARMKSELLERDAIWLPEKDAEIEMLRIALDNIENAYPDLDEYAANKCLVKVSFLYRIQNIARAARDGNREAANE